MLTQEQRAILWADMRRHRALAQACEEACMREHHNAIADALAAAIEEEVSGCRLVIKCDSRQTHSPERASQSRKKEKNTHLRGK